MSVIDDLLLDVKDVALRERLQKEIARLGERKKFGLVFENHIPECTALYNVPVRKGSLAATKQGEPEGLLTVIGTDGDVAKVIPTGTDEVLEVPLSNLISMARFGDPIFPALAPVDSIEADSESPLWHSLIEADNYHALQLLEYLYAGKVDCIYIDPPYNTGARDWKYNNDFVDSNDVYRHSKWLSMMERRLKIAKTLLNPRDSVLIVTIDEKEYLHLGCLLEDLFPDARIQMVSSVINHAGVNRSGEFSRSNEYIFIVMFGAASPKALPLKEEWRGNVKHKKRNRLVWNQLMRSGTNARRVDRPGLFYPIHVSPDGKSIVAIGEPIGPDVDRNTINAVDGGVVVWPIRSNGTEGNWQVGPEKLREIYDKGYVRLGRFTKRGMALTYLSNGEQNKLESGLYRVTGHRGDGSIVEEACEEDLFFIPSNQWDVPSHNATYYGSQLLNRIIGSNKFNFPKSLYAVEDTLSFFIKGKPDALVLDFFAGSGTTLQAVNLINRSDGGMRRCILVTNNEVSVEETDRLIERGIKPGDEEWEKLGIARYVTWPRTVCSIEGHDVNGKPLEGRYLDSGEPMSEGLPANVEFFKLTFLDRDSVELGEQFREILPLLWLRAGAVGPRPVVPDGDLPRMLIPERSNFAVLIDDRAYTDFRKTVNGLDIDHVFIVTDSDVAFQEMASRLTAGEVVQLYRDYLDNFVINGRSAI